jgi:hypothetical protein
MIPAEFEEPAYEAPLYNQLERGVAPLYTPGRVLEQHLGFDRGIYIAEQMVWETLGYSAPPSGMALGYYDWPMWFGPPRPRHNLPRFRLNLFLQAKRSLYYVRRPRSLARFPDYQGPMWAFNIKEHQQKLLMHLANRAGRRAHVAYAAPAFHTNAALFRHTRCRSIVPNSSFPSVMALEGHEAWYYREPGTVGVANPDPEHIEEQPFLERLELLAADAPISDQGEIFGFDQLAPVVIAAVQDIENMADPYAAQFFDDLQTLDRFLEPYDLRSTIRAFSQIRLFTLRFALTWLVHSGPS